MWVLLLNACLRHAAKLVISGTCYVSSSGPYLRVRDPEDAFPECHMLLYTHVMGHFTDFRGRDVKTMVDVNNLPVTSLDCLEFTFSFILLCRLFLPWVEYLMLFG